MVGDTKTPLKIDPTDPQCAGAATPSSSLSSTRCHYVDPIIIYSSYDYYYMLPWEDPAYRPATWRLPGTAASAPPKAGTLTEAEKKAW